MLNNKNKFMRGIDLGGWLSQCNHTKENYDNFITEEDFKIIAGWGLDHVRVPVDYNLVETKDGAYKEEGFLYIENAINWCRRYGLNMILDLHKTAGFSFDYGENEGGFFDETPAGAAYRERFMKLWEEFAKRFAGDSEMLVFELLNEVTNKEYMPLWSETIKETVKRIRKYSSEIDIMYGGYFNNAVQAVKDLPYIEDEHIIYSFHCYDPLDYTHQGATWIPDPAFVVDRRIPFEESGVNAELFIAEFAEAVEIANVRNVRLYCGEYGVIDIVSPEDTVKWYREINKAFEYYGLSRAAWTYRKMDFGISDERMDSVRSEILKLL